jgi:hypothetical protein
VKGEIEMKKYIKTTLVEVVERTPEGDYLVQNEGEPEYRWVIPKEKFESNYIESEGAFSFEEMREMGAEFGFGLAIEALKEGYQVARRGWNGKNMWLALVKIAQVLDPNHPSHGYKPLSWIGMKTFDDKFVPWLASQTDMLAEDWRIVE